MPIANDAANNKNTAEALLKPHPERLLLLGGAWLAMTITGVMGGIAIVNPEKKIPIIDPLIQSFKQEETVKEWAAPRQIDRVWDATHSTNLATTFWLTKVEMAQEAEKIVVAPTVVEVAQEVEKIIAAPASAVPENVAVAPGRSLEIPWWVYLAIAGSCIAGSSLITFTLYKATLAWRRKPVTRRQGSSAQGARPGQSRQRVAAMPVVKPRPVPAIAPLQISTPSNVELPRVTLEPVVDPQSPSRPKLSRAEQLAALARQAKQREAKSFIDSVDIRHRSRWASFS